LRWEIHGRAIIGYSALVIAETPWADCRASPKIGKRSGSPENGTVLVPLWLEKAMPTTLTLKNIPDEVYDRLKLAAEAHRRSLNSEAIVCLEAVLTPTRIAPGERLARARQLQAGLSIAKFRVRDIDIDTLKRQGRP
jgi:plasmid stability protein